MKKTRVALMLLVVLLPSVAGAAQWQWSAQIKSATSNETKGHPRAFLWIPPNCQRVRGVVVGQHNMQEEPILQHPVFREALADLGFAEIWVSPGFDLKFRFDQHASEYFDEMISALADVSGYSELNTAPVIPIGHSYSSIYPWNFAAHNPQRTLAVLSVSGQWPYGNHPEQFPNWWPPDQRNVDGVPGLVTMGEYEFPDENLPTGAQQRKAYPEIPLSMIVCPADEHRWPTDQKVALLALYLRKAAQYRLPQTPPANDGPVKLNPIDPTASGWLVDRWRKDQPPRWPAAPVGKYQGDPAEAFWFFDEEMAKAAQDFDADQRGKKPALVTFVQDGRLAEPSSEHSKFASLKIKPVDEGLTFKLNAKFLDTVSSGRPEQWTGLAAGSPLSHPASEQAIEIHRVCGSGKQIAPDTFAIRFYRMGMDNTKRSNEIWLTAVFPGDDHYKRAMRSVELHFPLRNQDGADQKITFDPIPDQKLGTRTLKLSATSNIPGAVVRYYVREGPAELTNDDTLQFTAIPPRARFPVTVTVVAWQWGRCIEPLVKTATPVERTFNIIK